MLRVRVTTPIAHPCSMREMYADKLVPMSAMRAFSSVCFSHATARNFSIGYPLSPNQPLPFPTLIYTYLQPYEPHPFNNHVT